MCHSQLAKRALLEYNPVDRAKGPETQNSSGKTMALEQVAALLDAAKGDRLELALRLLFIFGLRRGEVCALRRMDLDLEHGIITIHGTLGYVTGHRLLYRATKADDIRVFRLTASLIAAFRWQQTGQEAERKAMGWVAPDNAEIDYIFTNGRTGGPLNSARIMDAFQRAAKKTALEWAILTYAPLQHLAPRSPVLYSEATENPPWLEERAGGLLHVFDGRKTKTRSNSSILLISRMLTSG